MLPSHSHPQLAHIRLDMALLEWSVRTSRNSTAEIHVPCLEVHQSGQAPNSNFRLLFASTVLLPSRIRERRCDKFDMCLSDR